MQEFNDIAKPPASGFPTPDEYIKSSLGLSDKKKYAEAEQLGITAIAQYPEHAYLWYTLGKIQKELGQRDEAADDRALKSFETAHTLAPDDRTITMGLAKFLLLKGQHRKSEQLYLSLMDMDAPDIRLLTALGNLYQRACNYTFSAVCFGMALRLDVRDTIAQRRVVEISDISGKIYTADGHESFRRHVEQAKGQQVLSAAPKLMLHDHL